MIPGGDYAMYPFYTGFTSDSNIFIFHLYIKLIYLDGDEECYDYDINEGVCEVLKQTDWSIVGGVPVIDEGTTMIETENNCLLSAS